MKFTFISPPNSHNTLWNRQNFTYFTNRETKAPRAYWFAQFPQFANKIRLWDYMGPSCTTWLHLPFSFILFFLPTSLSSCICCVNWLKTKFWFKEDSCKPMNRQTFDRKHKHMRNKENKVWEKKTEGPLVHWGVKSWNNPPLQEGATHSECERLRAPFPVNFKSCKNCILASYGQERKSVLYFSRWSQRDKEGSNTGVVCLFTDLTHEIHY